MTIDVGTTLLALLSVSVFLPMHWMRIALLQPPDRNSGRDSHLPDFRKPAGECGFGPFHVPADWHHRMARRQRAAGWLPIRFRFPTAFPIHHFGLSRSLPAIP
jgi:hypothetical protein